MKNQTNSSRRRFLKDAVRIGGVAAVATSSSEALASNQASSAPSSKKGYQETAHIEQYYKTARF